MTTRKVTYLDDYRPDEVWNCTECGGQVFWLHTDGTVSCAECDDLIEDLRTVRTDDEDVAAVAAVKASRRPRDDKEDPEP